MRNDGVENLNEMKNSWQCILANGGGVQPIYKRLATSVTLMCIDSLGGPDYVSCEALCFHFCLAIYIKWICEIHILRVSELN